MAKDLQSSSAGNCILGFNDWHEGERESGKKRVLLGSPLVEGVGDD